jgi:hypothetical protein
MNPLSVQRENRLLATELGYEEGHPRYQWVHSSRLERPMVMIDDASKIIFDYHCRCGINQSVHSAECKFSVPRPKWEMRNLVPDADDQYILCRWIKPEASRDDWESMFGGFPYPAAGDWFPVGDPEKCIKLPSGQVPMRGTTEACISAIKDHFSRSAAQRSKDQMEKWDHNTEHLREDLRLKCIDAFPVHEGFPGEKHGWSHGGDPNTESPNLRKSDQPLVTLN